MATPTSTETSGILHITDFNQIPAYDELLSVGSQNMLSRGVTTLRVPLSKQRELVALGQGSGKFFVISTPQELRSSAWYQLINEGKSRGRELSGFATAEAEIFRLLFYSQDAARESVEVTTEDAQVVANIVAESSPLEWFKEVVTRCMLLGASDMHFEFRGQLAALRVRLDGLMRDVATYPHRVALDGISAAYTVLAEERSRSDAAFNGSVAQAAMIPLDAPPYKLTLRYQSHPAVGGLDVVVRILKAGGPDQLRLLSLDRLGYTDWQMKRLEEAVSSAWGGIFIAGVTGSGKTTTLNTLLRAMTRSGSTKLFTIEDPVEYEVNGVTHLSIQRQAASGGVNPFHAAMLAFLRMDPDVGLFGEIRDKTSGEMAQAAIQTGHKILTTVHATSALGIISRLSSESIQLKRQDLCSPEFISALVYQVLVPMNCEHCKLPAREVMSAEELAPYADMFGLDVDRIYCASEDGCPYCRKPSVDYSKSRRNGIKGVKVGAEVIIPDVPMLELMSNGRDLEARRVWRSRRTTGFDDPVMDGKEAWGHVLYDVSQGRVDPFYFERVFGAPSLLAASLESAHLPHST